MARFIVYDLILLVLFLIAVAIFLYVKRKNVKRQGVILLYKIDWGIKLMDSFSKKNKSWLVPLQYVIIACGVILMIGIVWLIAESAYLYLKFPIEQVVRAPPIAPLIPYFPKLFGLSSFLPPLYFTYFILAVVIGGVLHEFAHGIFARLNKLKVKSTGFLFLGPLLGAFVEPDEKQMEKTKKAPHMAILGAGTFANILIAIVFGIVLVIFFNAAFAPAGVAFNAYSSGLFETSSIQVPENFSLEERFVEVKIEGKTYLVNPQLLNKTLEEEIEQIILFDDAPAIRDNLPRAPSAIYDFDGKKITSFQELATAIDAHQPGDRVKITFAIRDGFYDTDAEFEEREVVLGEREGEAFLGIGVIPLNTASRFTIRGFFDYIFTGAGTYDRLAYYESPLKNVGWFIYFLLWWIFFINVLLAFFNMLPLGPLDGGRFFQLGVAGLFRSDKVGNKAFKVATFVIILLLALMMFKWFLGFF